MTFRFRLDGVLRFRKSVEQSEEVALYRIVREIIDVERELQQLESNQVRIREQREQDLTRTLPAVHLREIAERELELQDARQCRQSVRSRLAGPASATPIPAPQFP